MISPTCVQLDEPVSADVTEVNVIVPNVASSVASTESGKGNWMVEWLDQLSPGSKSVAEIQKHIDEEDASWDRDS